MLSKKYNSDRKKWKNKMNMGVGGICGMARFHTYVCPFAVFVC